MKNILNDEYDDFINSLNKEAVKGFYLNPKKDNVLKYLDSRYIHPLDNINDGYSFDYEKYPLGKSPFFNAGLYYIQEPSAMKVSHLIEFNEDDYVLDMCAAPGGKSCYIASKLSNNGLMICNDSVKLRANILSSNIERFGLNNAIVTNYDATKLDNYFNSFFDKIILDAPCSGEGMFRKLDEAINTWSIEKVNECAYIQKQLIDSAYQMLKKDGILIYSTCTYSLEENEKQVEYMESLGMEIIPIKPFKGSSSGVNDNRVIRIYPHKNKGEGQFMALAKKVNETNIIKPKILKPNASKEQYSLVNKFYQENLNIDPPAYLYNSNNHIYAINNNFPDLKGIRVVRNGLYLGECKKNRFEPSLSLALTLKKEDVKRFYEYSKDSKEIKDYLSGLTLVGSGNKGYGVIFVEEYPLSFFKESNNQIKNLYPKGLRR
ncbi:MAG: RsmF rRNA methyltransferase first C-terminal domain-containing protein [Thomasclavelia sp.]|nr:RsmF rRNA methyltransferase first C-terminal domain-containing protein [Thomasclavelia sp.]